ncbi:MULTISPECIES: acetyl-CoA acetyltransferase PhaA [unclassified Leptolyngbya]|uniref:acetyl-CoA acetyltransferase PhaA n=1 Tax=unclassified Leptolyngbya TaxID=2650499 RepID=UPI001685438C|nr:MULTISPECIES: acetyl-CoA acetyltransferase PhaA [unclassified Leptolyngbya]MBD1909035.1 thiolase family protein [Leptolyngbya sp. FACHB-8]MBD2153027.1 thiolase family protein [Leptolyngbya sp. FACHB-16]
MQEAYIVSAVRTPLGRFGGALAEFSPVELGAIAMESALKQAGVPKEALDLYILGNVLRAGHGQSLPRQAAFKTGIPNTVNGYAVDMVCSSGMMSVINAATAIRSGDAEIVLAGGMESMSQAGFFLSHRARWGYKTLMGTPEPVTDILLYDGLTDPTTAEGMGTQAERLAAAYGVTRADLDEVAYNSQQRAAIATEQGWFQSEITPVTVTSKKGTQVIDQDEGIRTETTLDSLAKLKPAFQEDGVFTAGNSSQISDGAAALVLASRTAVERYGLKPIARFISGAWVGGEAWRFPEVPILAVNKLLEKLNLRIYDFDLFENNEAFALSSVLFHQKLGIPHEKLNVYGGAIALGHPIGASGARIIVTLLNALQQRGESMGLAAVCHGTGGGTAIAVERL